MASYADNLSSLAIMEIVNYQITIVFIKKNEKRNSLQKFVKTLLKITNISEDIGTIPYFLLLYN